MNLVEIIMWKIVYNNSMNIDIKYNNYLTDLISLLQEAIFRTFSKKAIDQNKFTHYFKHIYCNMSHLEQSFVTDSLKITKLLHRLHQFLTHNQQNTPSSQCQPFNQHNLHHLHQAKHASSPQTIDQAIQRPIIRVNHPNKTITTSKELKSIQELEQEHQFLQIKGGKRRSETANGYRQAKIQNERPFTGKRINNRYKSITAQPPTNLLTQQDSHIYSFNSNAYPVQRKELKQKIKSKLQVRKAFYDELLRQKDTSDITLGNPLGFSLGLRKGYSKSQRKWAHKISRLL